MKDRQRKIEKIKLREKETLWFNYPHLLMCTNAWNLLDAAKLDREKRKEKRKTEYRANKPMKNLTNQQQEERNQEPGKSVYGVMLLYRVYNRQPSLELAVDKLENNFLW